jgi:hypothetical protein
MLGDREKFQQMLSEVHDDKFDRIETGEAEGYSSIEIPEPKSDVEAEVEAEAEEKKSE